MKIIKILLLFIPVLCYGQEGLLTGAMFINNTPTFVYDCNADSATLAAYITNNPYSAIANTDCDGDGYTNIQELKISKNIFDATDTDDVAALFVLMGQSNGGTGNAFWEDVTAPYQSYLGAQSDMHYWNGSSFVTYQTNGSTSGYGSGADFGPEWGFGINWTAQTGRDLYIVKRTSGDTGLSSYLPRATNLYWQVNSSGTLSPEAETLYTNAIANLEGQGKTVLVILVAWFEGENDANYFERCATFAQNLDDLVSDHSSNLATYEVPWTFQLHRTLSGICTPVQFTRECSEGVRDDTVAKYNTNVGRFRLIDLDDFCSTDGTHMTADGTFLCGQSLHDINF